MAETNYESVAAKLTGDIDKLRKKIAGIDQRRAVLALDAHIGDATAKREMDKLGDERNAKLGEIGDLEAALTEARRRAGEAKKTEALEAERKRAARAEPIVQRLIERGAAMDQATATYVANWISIQRDLDELAALGVPTPSRALVSVNLNKAHESALTPMGDKFVRPVPPTQRRSFDFLLKGWAVPAQRWISARMNTNAAQDAA